MFEFIKIQYLLGVIDNTRLMICVTKGYLTQEQAEEIKEANG